MYVNIRTSPMGILWVTSCCYEDWKPYLNHTRPISWSRFNSQHFDAAASLANQPDLCERCGHCWEASPAAYRGKDHKVGSWYFNQLGGGHCWDPIWIYPHYGTILLLEEVGLPADMVNIQFVYRVLYIRWCRISTINSITGWFQRFSFVIFYPYLGKRSNLDDFFQLVWNQHLVQRFMFIDVFFSGVTILFCDPCYEFLVGLA